MIFWLDAIGVSIRLLEHKQKLKWISFNSILRNFASEWGPAQVLRLAGLKVKAQVLLSLRQGLFRHRGPHP
jgi:hypothetical protein